MLSWSLIITFVLLVALAAFWQSGLSVRERANHAAQDACARMGVQFLDGTVAFSRLGLARDEQGQLTLRRTYVFDYTAASIERRQGFVVMLGQRLEHLGFERDTHTTTTPFLSADHVADDSSGHSAVHPAARGSDPRSNQPETHAAGHASDGKVLQLEEWRRRRAQLGNKPPPPPPRDQSDNGW